MARRGGQKMLQKWARRIQENQEDTIAAIDRIEEAPGVAAARKKNTYKTRVVAAVDKWERNVAAVPLEVYKSKAKSKGVRRAIEGAQEAANDQRIIAIFDSLDEFTANVRKTVRAMPNATQAEREARRKKAEDMMRQFKKPG